LAQITHTRSNHAVTGSLLVAAITAAGSLAAVITAADSLAAVITAVNSVAAVITAADLLTAANKVHTAKFFFNQLSIQWVLEVALYIEACRDPNNLNQLASPLIRGPYS
jgi:hypothetical protein